MKIITQKRWPRRADFCLGLIEPGQDGWLGARRRGGEFFVWLGNLRLVVSPWIVRAS